MDAFQLPDGGGESLEGSFASLEEHGLTIRFPVATARGIVELAEALRAARPILSSRPAAEIVGSLGRAAGRFLDPADSLRAEALRLLPATSGLSPEMSEAVLDHMAANWSVERLTRLLRRELGDSDALDRFVRTAEGEAMAVGPELSVQIVAGAVPGVGVDALVRSLLVKGPTLLKPGRGDVVLPVLFARALRDVDAALADAVAVLYWPGGSSETEDAALSQADVVTAYGSDETVRQLRARTPITARFVGYHHRVSVGLVGRAALRPDAIEAVAEDAAGAVAFFDQRGCVSPQVMYVEEGGAVAPQDFARALGRALEAIEARLPGGRLDAPEASALHQARGTAELIGPGGGVEVIHGHHAWWTVLFERTDGPVVSSVGRVVRVRPLADARELPGRLAPLWSHLQTVGVAGLGERLEGLAAELGRVGASRIVPFAAVAFPPPWWHHDGRGPLVDLVRWVDLERT